MNNSSEQRPVTLEKDKKFSLKLITFWSSTFFYFILPEAIQLKFNWSIALSKMGKWNNGRNCSSLKKYKNIFILSQQGQ